MEIDLRDVPDTLFDQKSWAEFRARFGSKEAALAAISRRPHGRYGYHGDVEENVPAPAEQKLDYAEKTFRLGNDLIGWLKNSLISGELKSTGVHFHLIYEKGEEVPVDIPAEQWRRLWPEFIDNRAFGQGRYEQVKIISDGRKKRDKEAITKAVVEWLTTQSNKEFLKKDLQARANAQFRGLAVRTFNEAYRRVFKRKTGRPRRSN